MIIGIDLGTTNSAVAIWRDDKAQLIPNSLGHVLTPSAVSVDDAGTLITGLAARERQVSHPAITATTFKRYMGSRKAKKLGKDPKGYLPEELSAMVLRSLKADAERFLGENVTDAVITVPAYFNDKQRQATRRAGQLAGLNVERLLNEPTAAALAYGIHQRDVESRFLVFDLGGGTFDVSVLEMFDGVIEVRASTGDNQLGGEDFNELLIDAFFRQHGDAMKLPGKQADANAYQRMREQAERCRRQLSGEPKGNMRVVWNDQEFKFSITEEEFEKSAEPLLERMRAPVLRALRDSNIHVETLSEIVLVGGATRMPIVRRAVTRMFGRFPAAGINPDEAVALGAAVQAGLKARDASLKEVVLTDVCPYSLGVDTSERTATGLRSGIFAPIIERNTLIPASRERPFSPIDDQQTEVRFTIYQGESRNVNENIALGSVSIPVPPGRASQTRVDVRFTYDINGLLEVDVHIPQTGQRRELVITDDETRIAPEELKKRRDALATLKVHPRDDAANLALIARAERLYEQSLGEKREFIARCLSQFAEIIDKQDPRAIEQARTRMSKALDSLDGETFL
jgi:molecular chaperone HscC